MFGEFIGKEGYIEKMSSTLTSGNAVLETMGNVLGSIGKLAWQRRYMVLNPSKDFFAFYKDNNVKKAQKEHPLSELKKCVPVDSNPKEFIVVGSFWYKYP